YTEDIEEMRKWIPLMMKGREDKGYMAASKIDEGTRSLSFRHCSCSMC
ncbi:MAG: malate:quinone oxidoreductase, partial [Streptococcus mitis]|nr:malate:quinone oxidoreductase [Streptococcus mitis]